MKPSRYKEYVEEQLSNRFVYEDQYGFLVYHIAEETCVLEEIYIEPQYRRQGRASKYYKQMETLALEAGCDELKGSIVIGTNNAEESMNCLFKNGFKLSNTEGVLIYLTKQLKE